MLTFGIDWDDVLAPLNERAIEIANLQYRMDPPLSVEEITSWENDYGRTSILHDIYQMDRLYDAQYVPEASKEFMDQLRRLGEVYIVTSVYPRFMGKRVEQIKTAFPDFPEQNIIMGAQKSLMHFDVLLDDCPDNILKSRAKYPVLMRRPWNHEMTGVLAVHNFEEFFQLLEQIKSSMVEGHIVPKEPTVIALVGPSGSRKRALANALTDRDDYCVFAPSYTTNPSAGNGFRQVVSNDEFRRMEAEFQEKTMYAGYAYGTKYGDIHGILVDGYNVVIPLDLSGAIAMKRHFPTIVVFCKRPREKMIMEILDRYAKVVHANPVEAIQRQREYMLRLLSMENELKNMPLCDLVVNTEDVPDAAEEILNFLRREGGVE